MQIWSTKAYHHGEQFSFWREVICEAFCALEPQRSDTATGFRGEVKLSEFGQIRCATVEASPHTVNRNRRELQRDPQEAFFINLQLGGSCQTVQGSNDAIVRTNDFAVLDLTRPYLINTHNDFSIICFRIPASDLRPWIRNPKSLPGSIGRGTNALTQIAASFMRDMWAHSVKIEHEKGAVLANVMTELIGLALAEDLNAVPRTSTSSLYGALAVIRRRLADPALSPQSVAHELHVSVRTLHKIFEETEHSFSSYVRHERLTRCAYDLKNPFDKRSVSEIAWRWGFNEPAHFSKLFKQWSGVSPRDFRAQIGSVTESD